MLHAKETGINSGRFSLWLVRAFTFFITMVTMFIKEHVAKQNKGVNNRVWGTPQMLRPQLG